MPGTNPRNGPGFMANHLLLRKAEIQNQMATARPRRPLIRLKVTPAMVTSTPAIAAPASTSRFKRSSRDRRWRPVFQKRSTRTRIRMRRSGSSSPCRMRHQQKKCPIARPDTMTMSDGQRPRWGWSINVHPNIQTPWTTPLRRKFILQDQGRFLVGRRLASLGWRRRQFCCRSRRRARSTRRLCDASLVGCSAGAGRRASHIISRIVQRTSQKAEGLKLPSFEASPGSSAASRRSISASIRCSSNDSAISPPFLVELSVCNVRYSIYILT